MSFISVLISLFILQLLSRVIGKFINWGIKYIKSFVKGVKKNERSND